MLYSHIINMLIYTYTCSYRIHTDAMNNRRAKTYLRKIYLSLYCNVCVWEGVGDRTELQYIDPHSYGRQCCVFLVLQGCSTGGPGAQGPRGPVLCWMMALFTASYHQLVSKTPSGVSRAPSAVCGFPYHISSLSRLISNCLTFCLNRVI